RASTSAASIIGNAIQITADTTFIAGSANTITYTGPATLTGSRTITQQSAGDIIFSGVMGESATGSGITLSSAGTGRLVLGGANTYTGRVTINAGVLSVAVLANGGAASGLGMSSSAASNLVLNGGSLGYSGSVAASTDRNYTFGVNGGGFEASGTVAAAA